MWFSLNKAYSWDTHWFDKNLNILLIELNGMLTLNNKLVGLNIVKWSHGLFFNFVDKFHGTSHSPINVKLS